MAAIHKWLVTQEAQEIPGTFLCNWNLTMECHREGKLLVYIDGKTATPVAYQWGGLVRPGILEVRYDMRGRGIGKKLVVKRIAQAAKSGQSMLVIQCKPSTSIPFWKSMGFTMFQSDEGKNYAYRIIEKKHKLPEGGTPVSVTVRVYLEKKKWEKDTPALSVASPAAVRTSDGVIHFKERISILSALHRNGCPPVVEIEINNVIEYCDKAKCETAEGLGVQRCTNGFYIDQILPSTPSRSDA